MSVDIKKYGKYEIALIHKKEYTGLFCNVSKINFSPFAPTLLLVRSNVVRI